MRSTSALYRYACEGEGCVSHTELVKFFHGVDVALQPPVSDEGDDEVEFDDLKPLPPILAKNSLIAFKPTLRYPTHITLNRTYLGDAGTAAFFRVLPMLRWLRAVEARGVGAGSRSVDALCGGLTSFLTEGCDEAPSRRLPGLEGEKDIKDVEGSYGPLTHPLAGRIPALELVDLRDNEAIFTQSVEGLLSVLRRRRATLMYWCMKQGEPDPVAVVLPALEVHITAANLLQTTAQTLQMWNAEAVAIKQRRRAAANERLWQEQLRAFTVPKDNAGKRSSSSSNLRPIGEHVVFRLPLANVGKGDDSGNAPTKGANVLREAINTHVDQFLSASCMLAPLAEVTAASTLTAAAQGARVALQALVDFGADALGILRYSNAVVWHVVRLHFQQQEQPNSTGVHHSEELMRREVRNLEAQKNLGALLHVLDAFPSLEHELLASQAAGGEVVKRHLCRLRQMYGELKCNITSGASPPQSETVFEEMFSLYNRVVAALVIPRFSAQHLPSMQAYEQRIEEVTRHVLDNLVADADDAEKLAAMVCRLRKHLFYSVPLPEGCSNSETPPQDSLGTKKSDETRLLPPIMAACYYHVLDHAEAENEWKQTYAGTSHAVGRFARVLCPTAADVPGATEAFHKCSCAAVPITTFVTGKEGVESYPAEPCTTCAFRTLQSVQDALAAERPEDEPVVAAAAAAHRNEMLLRWQTLTPVRQALPRELRMFFLDMMVRQRSRLSGGCVYVPPLDRLKTFGEQLIEERWSMTAWMACSLNQKTYWVEVLRMFGQWYRLRALEFCRQPEGQQLLRMTV